MALSIWGWIFLGWGHPIIPKHGTAAAYHSLRGQMQTISGTFTLNGLQMWLVVFPLFSLLLPALWASASSSLYNGMKRSLYRVLCNMFLFCFFSFRKKTPRCFLLVWRRGMIITVLQTSLSDSRTEHNTVMSETKTKECQDKTKIAVWWTELSF